MGVLKTFGVFHNSPRQLFCKISFSRFDEDVNSHKTIKSYRMEFLNINSKTTFYD